MVGPISTEDRERAALRLKLGSALVVSLSAGLIAVRGDASLAVIAAAVVVGFVVGAALVWFVFPGTGEVRSLRRRP